MYLTLFPLVYINLFMFYFTQKKKNIYIYIEFYFYLFYVFKLVATRENRVMTNNHSPSAMENSMIAS